MRKNQAVLKWVAAAAGSLAIVSSARAAVFITEVDPNGSSKSYAGDWFELKNEGSSVDLSGWKVDDNSNSFASAVPIRNGVVLPAGASILLIESNTSGTNDATVTTAFKSAWGLSTDSVVLAYGGSGVGLGSTGDSVNVYDSAGTLQANVSFGAAPTNGATFDNTAEANNATISTASAVGTNGAYVNNLTDNETGSPTTITATPEPASASILLAGVGMLARRKRR